MQYGRQRKKDIEDSILAECDRNDYPKAARIAAGYVARGITLRKRSDNALDPGPSLDLELLSGVLAKTIRCNRRDRQTEEDIGVITAHLQKRLDSRGVRALRRLADVHGRQTALASLDTLAAA